MPSHPSAAERRTDTTALHDYESRGWHVAEQVLDLPTVSAVLDRTQRAVVLRPEGMTFEADAVTPRALHGCHRYDPLFASVAADAGILRTVSLLLGTEDVYLYQLKVNLKVAGRGARWPWHQDFAFWAAQDGMPRPAAVSAAIFLDDVDEDNGPLLMLAGSHHLGLIPTDSTDGGADGWLADVSADLSHQLTDADVRARLPRAVPEAVVGVAGTGVFFHPNTVHSSEVNRSSRPRRLLILTYNRCDNAPANPGRPEFLVTRDPTRLEPHRATPRA